MVPLHAIAIFTSLILMQPEALDRFFILSACCKWPAKFLILLNIALDQGHVRSSCEGNGTHD
jgi:hypothetical protein